VYEGATECGDSKMGKNYLGAGIPILVAFLAQLCPLLHIDLGLDIYLHDEYVVIPLANIIFWLCVVAATAWILVMGVGRSSSRLR
jgi:hypothetical protein